MYSARPSVAHEAEVEIVRVSRILFVVYAHREAEDLGAKQCPGKRF